MGLHQSLKSVVVTRYYTQDELRAKRATNEAAGKGSIFVSPTATQHLNKECLIRLVELYDEILNKINMVLVNEELDESDCLIPLHNGIMVGLDADNMLVHLRRYWFDRSAQKYKPNKRKSQSSYLIIVKKLIMVK